MGSIEVSLGVLSLTIAGTAVYFAEAAHKLAVKKHQDDLELAKKKREDDLFDRRYALYEEIHMLWLLGQGTGQVYWNACGHGAQFRGKDLSCFSDKALFLFDEVTQAAVNLMVIRLLDIGYPGFEDQKGKFKTSTSGFPRELFCKYLNLAGGEVIDPEPEKSRAAEE